jgi:thymidylate kinase
MDGPSIARSLPAGSGTGLANRLLKSETRLYEGILPPDILVVFRVDPEIAVRRKPNEDPAYVRARTREIWQLDWRGTNAQILDANQPLEQIRSELRSLLWSEL